MSHEFETTIDINEEKDICITVEYDAGWDWSVDMEQLEIIGVMSCDENGKPVNLFGLYELGIDSIREQINIAAMEDCSLKRLAQNQDFDIEWRL